MNSLKKIAIAGFGMEGRALYEYLKGSAELHIFDERQVSVEGINATLHQDLSIPSDFDVVYKSPGIPTHKLLLESPHTHISTLMDIVLEKVGERAIGVTGTKGKSTVASLIYHILHEAGKNVELFGNIGVADMNILKTDSSSRIYVIELSSYQCEHITHSPHIAVLTNLYEEHLSHHGSFEAYRDAKMNITKFQKQDDVFIQGDELPVAQPFETKLLGAHNQKNCAIALAAAEIFGVSEVEARKHIATFNPLPYRLEKVGEYGGITFYDDSLATIPQATLASIAALPRVDTIILGGEDRGISFDAFAEALAKTAIATFIIFPDTGGKMLSELKDRRTVPVSSMEEAVKAAYAHTPVGGTVLLSNASPSFNLFKDYKDKSAQYRKWIQSFGSTAKL